MSSMKVLLGQKRIADVQAFPSFPKCPFAPLIRGL